MYTTARFIYTKNLAIKLNDICVQVTHLIPRASLSKYNHNKNKFLKNYLKHDF